MDFPCKHEVKGVGATFGLFGDPMGFSFYHKKMESNDTLSEGERLIFFNRLFKILKSQGLPLSLSRHSLYLNSCSKYGGFPMIALLSDPCLQPSVARNGTGFREVLLLVQTLALVAKTSEKTTEVE